MKNEHLNLSVDIKYSTVEIVISLLMLQGCLKPRINKLPKKMINIFVNNNDYSAEQPQR